MGTPQSSKKKKEEKTSDCYKMVNQTNVVKKIQKICVSFVFENIFSSSSVLTLDGSNILTDELQCKQSGQQS